MPGGGEIPDITVRDESASSSTPNSKNRKLLVSFGSPLKFTVKPGKDVRSIDIVLVGMGDSVQAVVTKRSKLLPLMAASPVAVTPAAPTTQASTETEATAAALLTKAQSAFDGGNYQSATESLNQLLNLPPNGSSRKAQEMAGLARINEGDKVRAATEFELFLKLYPTGEDSDRVRQLLASLPTIGAVTASEGKPAVEVTSTVSGSLSAYYYGGKLDEQGVTRNQDFVNSPFGQTPVTTLTDNNLSNTSQKQLQTSFDMNYRYRDDVRDMRFVVRDSLTRDYLKGTDKERLSALYVDYRSLALSSNIRVGRQSPNGGGVMYRFDGMQAGYKLAPKWKINGVIGKPSDALYDTRRTFYGLSIDAEALTKTLSGSAYVIEQVVDGVTDRRGVGTEVRYFKGGLSANGQLDYDPMLRQINIAAFQSYWQYSDDISLNAMLDRRTTPFLSLSNALYFQDPNLVQARRISELLGTVPIEILREQVKALTGYQNQFRVGGTKVLTPKWQVGGDFSLTKTDKILPVPVLAFGGAAAQNNWTVSTQLIGTNLYSARDTHVFNITFLAGDSEGDANRGLLLSYNNLTSLSDKWQLEPSLRYQKTSTDTPSSGANSSNTIFGAGMRVTYRLRSQLTLESELTYQRSKLSSGQTSVASTTSTDGTSTQMSYYLGARADF